MIEDPLHDAVVSWIQNNCIEVKTTEPSADFFDLNRLKPILADVDILGLGEATHGTHEFFELKHRLFRFLVREMGFTTLAFEAPFAGCKNINAFINHEGHLEPALALRKQGMLVWQTEEVIELIEWMHEYNREATQSGKIRFVGIDCQMDETLVKDYSTSF